MNENQKTITPLSIIFGGIAASLVLFGILAILSVFFDNSDSSKGRLLARKERCSLMKTEYFESGVEHQSTELLKVEIFEPKRFAEVYGKKG